MAKAGQLYVNNGNGREKRATAVAFDNPTGTSLYKWVKDMVDDKLMLSTGTADIDHYLAIGNEQAAMTIDTSAALGTISQMLGVGPVRGGQARCRARCPARTARTAACSSAAPRCTS